MITRKEANQELGEETIDSKTPVKQSDEVASLNENAIQDKVMPIVISQEDGEGISLDDVHNEKMSNSLLAESNRNKNSIEHCPENAVIMSVEFHLNGLSNGKVNDDGETLYDKDELNMCITVRSDDKPVGYEDAEHATESMISGAETVKESSFQTVCTDIYTTETGSFHSQDITEKEENSDLETNELIHSANIDGDVDSNECRQDENLDEAQDSVVSIESVEHNADFTETVRTESSLKVQFLNRLSNEETFRELNPVVVESDSSHKQLTSCLRTTKTPSVNPKLKKSVSITEIVCEENETELGSIIMGILDKPRTARMAVASTGFEYNVLEEYLSKYAKETENTGDADSVYTIRFILGSGKMFAGAFKGSCSIKNIKAKLASLFGIDDEIISLKQGNYEVSDWLTLHTLCGQDIRHLDLELSSRDMEATITAEFVSKFLPTIEVIIVHSHLCEDTYKDIVVEIENQSLRKEWLGGYHNRNKNLVYHHAATQTLPKERKVFEKAENGELVPILYERQTQTPFQVKNFAVDTPVNKATQMYRRDYYVPCIGDKIISPTDFVTYEQWLENNDVIKKVVTIQRAVKNWMKNKTFKKLYEAQRMALKMFRDEKVKILTEQAERKRKIISGAALPTSRDDFYMLYLMVGRWWKKEWQRIKDIRSDESRKAEYIALLEKEIELLSAIEKQRITVKEESLLKEKMRFLEVTSRPTVFRNERGVMTSMDRVDTQIARTLKDTYSTLIRTDLTPEERIDFLLMLRNQIVQYYNDYEFFHELIALIERELDFLAIRTEAKALTGLRKRIELFYLDLVKKPKYNLKAQSYRKAKWPKTVDTLYLCIRCQKLLPVCDFPIHTRLMKILVCTSCEWLQNIGHQRLDMSPYLKLLRQVQKVEMQKCCYTSLCFLLQQIGMYFLTRIIWHGHSAISETRNLAKLCMVRWNNREEWTPWNTILLTEQEAEFHASIDDVEQFYSPAFISSVHQKHILARIHFLPLLKTDHALRSTGAWQNITDSGVYIHPTHIKEHFENEAICDMAI